MIVAAQSLRVSDYDVNELTDWLKWINLVRVIMPVNEFCVKMVVDMIVAAQS